MRSALKQIRTIREEYIKDEITVYAAQASFFIVLSFFPFIMILLTLIQMIPSLSQDDLLFLIRRLAPTEVYPLVSSIITDLFTTAPAAILSLTTIATLWSAARGMQGIERGLNRIDGCSVRRGYIIGRLINAGYTVIFLVVCVASMVLMVFGSSLQKVLFSWFPFLSWLSPYMVLIRAGSALAILIVFFAGIYTWLPCEPHKLKTQLPGACFSTAGWICSSFGFSIYFSHFKRFSYMYGSLAAVMILMLWLYFGICILFIGAEINRHLKRPQGELPF